MSFPALLIGIALGVLIAALARSVGALSRSGTWAAALVGGVIFGLGGFQWAALLLTFFISSSALSRTFIQHKTMLGEKFAKGSSRDAGQVLANGGLGSLLALCLLMIPEQDWPWLAFAGAMAAVTGDTWATELGVAAPNPPRLITTWEVVERGASGGVTLLGTLATVAGAALIGLLAGAFSNPLGFIGVLSAVTVAGLVGGLVDSLLGATVQAIYYCPMHDKETERHPLHTCGTPTTRVRGWRWLNNDLVNFISSAVGAIVSVGVWRIVV